MPESTSETSASKSQKKAPAAQESKQEVSKKPPHIPLAQDKPKPKPKPKLQLNINAAQQSIKPAASHITQQPQTHTVKHSPEASRATQLNVNPKTGMPFPPPEAPKGATSYYEPSNYLNRKNAELPIERSGIWKVDPRRPWLGLIEMPVWRREDGSLCL
jgi:hypothetical protein